MTDFPSYAFGTVTVAAAGTIITGTDTIWSGVNARAGDDITIGGNTVIITDVTDETHLVIDAWPYAAVTDGTYKITQRSPLRFVGGEARADLTTLLATLKAKGLLWYLDPAYAEPDYANPTLTADEGQAILKIDTGAIWVMQGGAWVAGGTFKGIVFKGAYDAGTAYSINDVVTSAGSAYIVIAATTGNAPPNATYYSLLASKGDAATVEVGTVTTGAGGSAAAVTNSGTTGAAVLDFTIPAGKGYGGTSVTSLLIGTGSKVFTTQSGLAYTDGVRVRASSAANTSNWMEGLATYSGTTLTIDVSRTNGAGTLADWNLNIVGEPGAGDLSSANNLSDIASATIARENLAVYGGSVDLRSYDYVADGVTDNTTAVNDAIAYANGVGDVTFLVPEGTGLVGNTNAITADNVWFKAMGAPGTCILQGTSSAGMLTWGTASDVAVFLFTVGPLNERPPPETARNRS